MLPLLMLTLFFATAAPSSNDTCRELLKEACAPDDLACVKCLLAQKYLEIDALGRQLATSMEQTRTANELVEVWKTQSEKWKEASDEALKALKPLPWYREPVLWFAIGGIVFTTLTVALVYAIAPVFK